MYHYIREAPSTTSFLRLDDDFIFSFSPRDHFSSRKVRENSGSVRVEQFAAQGHCMRLELKHDDNNNKFII